MKFNEMNYERIDIEKAAADLKGLENVLGRAQSGQEQFDIHKKYYELTDHVMTELTIAEIRHDVDVTDEYYKAEQKYYDEKKPLLVNAQVSYQRALFNSKYRPFLEEKIGPVAFKNIEIAMKSVDEKILPLMQEENKLTSDYDDILATAKIKWNGQDLNLSLMNPYIHNADRSVRIDAWKAYSDFFGANKEQLDDIYDKLIKNRTKQATDLGYKNYLTLGYYRMNRNCYGRDDVAQFRKQVKKDFVPLAQKIQDKRRQRLGLSALHFEDEGVAFSYGNPAPFGTPKQILEAGRQMYKELSPETGKFMDFMCENDLFDVLGRKTKKTGGYMTYLPDYKSPFIFANFNGSSSDVDVITHECGHAFQGYVVANDPIREHLDITMETAETHSMSMEFFTEPWMKNFFGDKAKDYVDMHFEDACLFIPYGTMVDEFQDIVYDDPTLSPSERNHVWRDLEKQYKPHLDYSGNSYYENGGFWQKQHHIYDYPLYYIDYCIAQTNALQYKVWMDKDYKGAFDSYLELCKLSASDFFDGLISKVGLDNPFEDGCLLNVVQKLSLSGRI